MAKDHRPTEAIEKPAQADPLAPLEATLGYHFSQRPLLVDALTHRSYLNEVGRSGVVSN